MSTSEKRPSKPCHCPPTCTCGCQERIFEDASFCIGHTIAEAKHRIDRRHHAILKRRKILAFNEAQGRILCVLWHRDGLSMSQICDGTGLAMTTLSTMVRRMEERGLLRRVVDPKDRRMSRVFLEERARRFEPIYREVTEEISGKFFEDFSEEERKIFEALLKRGIQNLRRDEEH